jgi:15-cis-phytoene synthase
MQARPEAMAAPAPPTAEAYELCEQVTRSQARNFYYGIRLLPAGKRQAMSAVYAFARRVDDIGDGSLADEDKLRCLDELDAALPTLAGPSGAGFTDPVLLALADASRRFELPGDALSELIAGVRMDVVGARYEHFEDLVLYCRRVAGGIGRLCLAIFGRSDGRAAAWAPSAAEDLGVAMQLTNILRDLHEDAARGRVYLPREDLLRFGLLGEDAHAASEQPELAGALLSLRSANRPFDQLIAFEVGRAREWFARGMSLMEELDWRSSACVLAMIGIYRRLLDRIAARPAATLEERLSLPTGEKLWVATQSMLGVGA